MILVFGNSGQVATELQRRQDVVALGRDKVDLIDLSVVKDAINTYKPRAVVNAAAYTAVDKAEAEASLAMAVNCDAPIAMAEACLERNIPLVHISSDYVFSGAGMSSWAPLDEPNPINMYGHSKLAGENGIRSSGAVHAVLRTSWVFSAHGSNFVKTMLRLSNERDILQVVSDQIGGPTPASDIAEACLHIAEALKTDPGKTGTYHYSGAPDISWAEFAKEIFVQSNRSVRVDPILTADYATIAARPCNSRLDCSGTEQVFGLARPDWRIGLQSILKELKVI